jgi:hypothetical protein
MTAYWLMFLAGAAVSLAASWVLVRWLERIEERLGFVRGAARLTAALAADAPEITAAITAIAGRQ